jgi:acyl-CoA reductase-like NAD-dependent aldehyde dehydrogenase
MRILFAAAAAVLCTSGLAWAQPTETTPSQPAIPVPATTCGELPTSPTLPDGASANHEAMQASQDALQAFDTSYRANMECRRAELDRLAAQLQARRDEYNAGASNLNALLATWQTEIDEFNARQPRRRNNRN